MNFPTLYYKSATGALCVWTVSTKDAEIITIFGQQNGKMLTASKLATPKNISRVNQTSAKTQAEIEARAMFEHKLKRKYSKTPEEAEYERLLPMLAKDFEKNKTAITYPVYVQPKLDGFRCLAAKEDGVVTLYSRSGDIFDLPHIARELDCLLEGSVIDGELYCHGVPFQKVASWIKKQHIETARISYNVYDIAEMGGRRDFPMTERVMLLQTMELAYSGTVTVVHTDVARNRNEVYDYQRLYVERGYEGAIVRIPTGKYQYGYRSYGLLKVKTFTDEEFKIVGGQPGVGRMKDCCIFVCALDPAKPSGRTFNVVPRGTEAERQAYLRNLPQLKGKMLKVKFFGRSEDGIPRFPIGLGVREEFDK